MNIIGASALIVALAAASPLTAGAQRPMVNIDGASRLERATLLPSRVPVHYIGLDVSAINTGQNSASEVAAIGAVANSNNWQIEIRHGGRSRTITAPGSQVIISRDRGTAQLVLRMGALVQNDTIRVALLKNDTLFTDNVAHILSDSPVQPFTLRLDPKQTPDQKLIGGGTADVIQFGINAELPSILGTNGRARVFARTQNVLSTDERDAATRVQGSLGAELSPLRSWYLPIVFEGTFQANQPFSNTSVIGSTGVRTIVPWRWTSALLWNRYIRAPISPEFGLAGEYQWRIQVDTLVAAASSKDNVVRLSGRFDWAPIYLLPGREADLKDIVLEPSMRGWFFPASDARGGTGIREFEGRADISLYVPISGFPAASFLLGGTAEETMTRLKVQFVSGANEANGFIRSVEWKLGFEVAK